MRSGGVGKWRIGGVGEWGVEEWGIMKEGRGSGGVGE